MSIVWNVEPGKFAHASSVTFYQKIMNKILLVLWACSNRLKLRKLKNVL